MPATSSQSYMITPPWTLPPLFASAIRIQRLSIGARVGWRSRLHGAG